MSQQTIDGIDQIKITPKIVRRPTAITPHRTRSQDPADILRQVEEEYGRDKFYVLCSGGKDSQTVCDFVAEQGKLAGVAHVRTNIGLSMTTDFIKDYCQSKGYPCHIIDPNPKYVYVSDVLQHGFPGPGYHGRIMMKLKYIAMRNFAFSIDKKRHCLISGVRHYESARRMQRHKEAITNDGNLWMCAPYFYKKDADVYREFISKGLPISPAYKHGFSISGECLCGCFADGIQEKELIRKVDPKLSEFIEWLEEGVRKFGTAEAQKYAKWGGMSRMEDLDLQTRLDDTESMEGLVCGQECGPGSYKEYETSPVNGGMQV